MDVFVDGELESLLGMFNFDQCSSSKEEKPRDHEILGLSSLYNDHMNHHQHQNNVLSSDHHQHQNNVLSSDHHQHQNNVLSSDHHHHGLLIPDMFPFGAMPSGNLPVMLDSWDQNHHQLHEMSSLKRKLHDVDNNLCKTNSNSDVTRQELTKSKKKQRISSESNGVEESNTDWRDGQSLSNSSDDEKASVTSVKGKTRATKGTATDPQSLYARKRREKINERLKTLQNLVPNGTKVDISTMLEEAVHYVKFLQLQIKLLSSDDLWMYAPLAYNGLDMGFHHNLLSRLM